jgi:Tol biopolymer transport system component
MANADTPSPPSPDDWSEVSALIDVLLDTPVEHRAARIAELSAGDASRQAELEALLAECEREPPLLTRSAAERFAALLDTDAAQAFPDSLADRYELRGMLGRGGAATVYLARDLKHGRDVAVKVLRGSVAAALGAERFLREIGIAARLRHPLIVPLYDSGDADGQLYYVMPYEAGLSLRERLSTAGALTIADAVRIIRDVCEALAHAHERGIVHRDIKPENVLLTGGHALVADFGVAKAASDASTPGTLTGAGLLLGTPAYMAPEQIAADPTIDHRADIYAVGVLGYELLAGHPPFVGAARQDVLSAHLAERPAPIATLRPDTPAPLADLVMRCLEKRPGDRWQTVDEMIRRLDALPPAVAEPVRADAALPPAASPRPRRTGMWTVAGIAAVTALAMIGVAMWRRGAGSEASWRARWSTARVERLTDFAGDEVDAAISADGRFVAFLADRDSTFNAFVGQVGSGQFVDLTGGRVRELYNDDVRNIGFTRTGTDVWLRVGEISSPARIALVPTMGGELRPFLGTAVTAVWSADGSRLAYHEATPGDPIYVADADGANARRVLVSPPGVHTHHPSWSPDGRYLYFTGGTPPDAMDVWRVRADGGTPERITEHRSRVAHPVMLDDRTLFYTATADDGTGPWLYSMDVERRVPHRVSTGVEHYLSISASAPTPGTPRRLAATVSNPTAQLWSVPITSGVAGEERATPIALPTARAAAPRFAPAPDSSLLYLASRGGADGLWRLSRGVASEVWRLGQGVVAAAAAVSPDGQRVCVPVRRDGRSTLRCAAADGSGARTLAESLDVRGAASWSPDGRWIVVAAADSHAVRVYKVPVDSGLPVRLVDSVSSNPVWSPDGTFIVYSGTPRGRSVPLLAVTPQGTPHPMPPLMVDRIGDSYRFLPIGGQLVVKLGGFRRQDFWMFDLATGERRQLTRLRPGESVTRFDLSPDGTRIVFERVRENSDVALIELATR